MRRIVRLLTVPALAVGLSGCFWGAPGYNADRSAYNPVENSLSPANVDDLTEAWTAGPYGSTVEAPVVSADGVHAAVGGCGIATLDPATGTERWVGSWAGGLSTCASPNPIVEFGAPFVTGDARVLSGVFTFQQSTPSPRFDTFTQGYRTATGEEAGRLPGLLAGVRGDQAVLTSPIITTLGGPLPIPTGYGPMAYATFGPLDDAAAQRTIRTALGSSTQPTESAPPTLGASLLFHAGTGVLSTTPGDPTTGRSVRAYSLTEARPGCGPSTTPVECPVWSQPVDGAVSAAPVIGPGGNRLYVVTQTGMVTNHDADNGILQWSASVGAPVVAEPAIAGGVLYVPVADGRLVAFDALGCGAVTCPPLWTASAGSGIEVQPAVAGGLVFTGSVDGSVHAFAAGGCGAATCPSLWSASTGSRITGAPAVAVGSVYVGTADGRVVAYRRP